jgi:hypothetical protein
MEYLGKFCKLEVTSLNMIDSSIFAAFELVHNVGWVGPTQINKYFALLYKSTDLGETWEVIPLNSDFRARRTGYFQMVSPQVGILTQLPDSNELKDRIIVTENAWKDYKVIDTNKITMQNKYGLILSKVADIQGSNIVIFSAYNEILHSSDFGDSWTSTEVPLEYHNNSVATSFTRVGNSYYVYGVANNIVKTDDYGATWETVSEGQKFRSLSSYNSQIFSIDGESRSLLETRDGGKSFSESFYYKNGDMSGINDVDYIDSTRRIAISGNEVVLEQDEKYLIPPTFVKPEKFYDLEPNFTVAWTANDQATSYDVMVKELTGFSKGDIIPAVDWEQGDIFFEASDIADTVMALNNQNYDKWYAVKVRCKNDSLESQWNQKDFFTTKKTSVELRETSDDEFLVSVDDYIHISSQSPISSIQLYNYAGSKVYEKDNINDINFAVSNEFGNGVYFIIVDIKGSGKFYKKILIK